MKQFAALCLFALAGLCNAAAQSPSAVPLKLGLVEKIHSAELSEDRTLNIYLPDGYSPDSAARYPVIYLLDGSVNEDFLHVTGIVQFLTMIEAIPPSIVVGIANVDRKRDFTFPTTVAQDKKDFPTTGSSARFISFLEKELQPFIQSHYKTAKSRTIIGQSLGGLLAAEILIRYPGMFDQYIIVSPSLWWDNESLLKVKPAVFTGDSSIKRQVYISVGSEGAQMEGDAKRFAATLKAVGAKKQLVHFLPLPAENHLTILHNSVYKAFNILYRKKKR